MLDSEAQTEAVTEEPPVEAETPEAEAVEVEAEPEGEIVVSIEGEEAETDEDAEVEAELGDKGRHALKAAREAAKIARQEARELKAKLAEREAAQQAPAEDTLGPRPVIADYGFNDDLHADALLAWHEKKRSLDAKKAEAQEAERAKQEAYQAKLTKYHAERGKVGVDDDAQGRVVAALNAQQQAALMDASGDPAKVVAALAKTPKVLAQLAGIKEIHKFCYELAKVEGRITMTTKAPPPPESRLKGGVAAPSGSLNAQLVAAEKKFDANGGDRSEIIRLKRLIAQSGNA